MRRLIAYISMVIAILIGVGVSFAPTFTKMKEGREFASGREIVFTLKDKENEADPVKADAAEKVADIMKERLDLMNVEDYSVKIGTNKDDPSQVYADTISVSFSTQDDTLFNYVSRLLEFSGKDFSLRGNLDEAFAENVFKDVEAYIYRDSGTIPYVIFPVSDSEAVKTFLKVVSGEDEESEDSGEKSLLLPKFADVDEGEGESEEEGEQKNPDVFLCGNWGDDDSIEKASENPYSAEKVICSWNHENIWNPDSKEAETELRFLCGSANESGEYDLTALKKANQQASFLLGMFNAKEYEVAVENKFKDVTVDGGIKYNYLTVEASYENLISFEGNSTKLAWSATLKATLIGVVIVSLLLAMFFRLQSLAAIATSLLSLFFTYLLFFAMTPTFNVAAIVGGIVVALLSIFGEIVYMHRFRDEVYKGRSLKKANTEAFRRSNLIVLDGTVLVGASGLLFYLLGGEALKSFGVIAFFGAIISFVLFHIVYRILNWLLANTTNIQTKYSLFNIDESKVPNIALDEKPNFESPYEKTDFTKKRKALGIVGGVLLIASLAGIITFGVLNGSPINTKKASDDHSVIYTSIQADDDRLNSTLFSDEILAKIVIDGKAVDVKNVSVEFKETKSYDLDEKLEKTTYQYVAKFDNVLSNDKVQYKDGEDLKDAENLQDAVVSLVEKYEIIESGVTADVRVTGETVSTPNQGEIALATGITLAAAFVYCAFRYRLSRACSLLVVSTGVTTVTYGLLTLTRLATSSVSAILLPIVAISSLLTALFYLSREKELDKEEKAYDATKRSALVARAASLSALPVFTFTLIGGYLAINFFGFGPVELTILFGAVIVGTVLTVLAVLSLMGPLASVFDRLFSKVRLPKLRRHKENKQHSLKPKTSEPQETIFIGIND